MADSYRARKENVNDNQPKTKPSGEKKRPKDASKDKFKNGLQNAGAGALKALGVPAPLANLAKRKNQNPLQLPNRSPTENMPRHDSSRGDQETRNTKEQNNPFAKSGLGRKGILDDEEQEEEGGESQEKSLPFQKKTSGTGKASASGAVNIVATIKKIPPFVWPAVGFAAVIFLVVFGVIAAISNFFPMFGSFDELQQSGSGMGGGDSYIADPNSPEGKYQQRLNDIYEEYKNNDKQFKPELISGVFFIVNRQDDTFNYDQMDDTTIRTLADFMFKEGETTKVCENSNGDQKIVTGDANVPCPDGYTEKSSSTKFTFDEEQFKSDLKEKFLKSKFPNKSDDEINSLVDQIYEYIDDYQELITSQGTVNKPPSGSNCYINGNTQASVFYNLSSANPDEILNIIGPMAQADYSRTGIFASVTIAQFIYESGWGKSDIGNNMFGIKCSSTIYPGSPWKPGNCRVVNTTEEYTPGEITHIKDSFRVYDSVEASIADHSALLLYSSRYKGVESAKTPREQIEIIKNGGYATASGYVDMIMKAIKIYDLDKWDVITNTTTSPLTCITSTDWTIRTVKPGPNDKAFNYISGNRGQCVWYAQARAVEIVEELASNGTITKEQSDSISQKLLKSYGNAEGWYPNTRGVFKGSDNIKEPKPGSIIVWGGGSSMCSPKCGHVAVIEEINEERGTITLTDGWASSGNSCPNSWSCVEFRTRTMSLEDFYRNAPNNFGSYSGSMFFKGYVYFLEPES